MEFRCDLLETPKKAEDAIKFYMEVLIPIMNEYWEQSGKNQYFVDTWELPPIDFVNLWMKRNFLIVMAYDEKDAVVGFAWGMKVRPFLYDRQILQIEPYWGRTKEIETQVVNYFFKHRKFFEVDEVVIPVYSNSDHIAGDYSVIKSRKYNTY